MHLQGGRDEDMLGRAPRSGCASASTARTIAARWSPDRRRRGAPSACARRPACRSSRSSCEQAVERRRRTPRPRQSVGGRAAAWRARAPAPAPPRPADRARASPSCTRCWASHEAGEEAQIGPERMVVREQARTRSRAPREQQRPVAAGRRRAASATSPMGTGSCRARRLASSLAPHEPHGPRGLPEPRHSAGADRVRPSSFLPVTSSRSHGGDGARPSRR